MGTNLFSPLLAYVKLKKDFHEELFLISLFVYLYVAFTYLFLNYLL